MNANLFAIICERIASQANVLLRTVEGAIVTYGDMLERSGRLANILVLRGVEPGEMERRFTPAWTLSAAGDEHVRLKAELHELTERLLAEPVTSSR